MMRKSIKFAAKLTVVLAGLYVLLAAVVYIHPQWFFYNPAKQASRLEFARENGYPAQRVEYGSADGTPLYAWFTAPGNKGRMIVFMHGNSYNIEKFYHKMIPLLEAGYGTMMPEYRGFGDVKGIIRQENLVADAEAAVDWLHKQGYKNADIVIYGMSLGTYMAARTAYDLGRAQPFRGLILEVPFDSLLNTARRAMPLPMPFSLMMRDHYDTARIIKEINTPLLIMGGSDDPTIPVDLAQNLFRQAVEPKKMIIYKGGAHSDLYNFRNYRDILNWLEADEKTR